MGGTGSCWRLDDMCASGLCEESRVVNSFTVLKVCGFVYLVIIKNFIVVSASWTLLRGYREADDAFCRGRLFHATVTILLPRLFSECDGQLVYRAIFTS